MACAAKAIFATFEILKKADGNLTSKEVMNQNGDTFIELWKNFYSKLSDEEKNLLPLQPICFLGPNE